MFLRRIIRLLIKHLQNYFLFYFILVVTLIIGIVIGSLIINLFDLSTKLTILRYSNPYYKIALIDDYMQLSIMRSSIFSSLFLILFTLLISVLNIGILISPLFVLVKGVSVGFTVGFLVNSFGIKGFLVSLGGIYPQNIFILSGLIGLSAISMSTTNYNKKSLGRSRLRYNNRNLEESLLLGGIYSSIIIVGAFIEGFISHKFLSLTLDFFI